MLLSLLLRMTSKRNKSASERGVFLSGGRCVVCGWCSCSMGGVPLVEGAHVKPLENDEKSDNEHNIIALCPNHHTMFDHYLFYIDSQTKKLVFRNQDCPENGVDVSAKITHISAEYLAYREYLFKEKL